jgi:Chaperone of endosialidase
MKTRILPILITFALVGFALLPIAQAVVPPPDGGYSGFNTAEGQNALMNLTTGEGNTAVGWFSLKSLATGSFNTGVGSGTLALNTANNNTATGAAALFLNTTGDGNTANGVAALLSNSTGAANTANGMQALFSNTTGFDNTAVGWQAMLNNTIGFNNTAIGIFAGYSITTASNVVAIGTPGANVDNSCYIGGIAGADATGGDPVFVTGDGKLGTINPPSSARFKEEIKPMNEASEVILSLNPVTFRYKKEFDPKHMPQFGLVAEEVEKVNPGLVKRDRDGKLQTVRYEAVNAMLLNEFLKEHTAFVEQQRKLEQQGAIIARQQKQIEALAAGLQKVSAQLELRTPAPQTVLNTQ